MQLTHCLQITLARVADGEQDDLGMEAGNDLPRILSIRGNRANGQVGFARDGVDDGGAHQRMLLDDQDGGRGGLHDPKVPNPVPFVIVTLFNFCGSLFKPGLNKNLNNLNKRQFGISGGR